jgi:hypothetical protein
VPDRARATRRRRRVSFSFSGAIFAGGLAGALLLVIAEFTNLYSVHTATSPIAIETVSTGSHHAYALIPIALLVVMLAFGVWRAHSRPALLAIGALGVVSLLIALLGDLPDAQATGLIGNAATHFAAAAATPAAGLYLETAGSAALIITCVCGFILLGPPPRPASSRAAQSSANG